MDDEAFCTEKARREYDSAPVCEECERKILGGQLADRVREYLDVSDGEFTVDRAEGHHLQYDPEETVTVCQDCHADIQNTEKYPDLKPIDEGSVGEDRAFQSDMSMVALSWLVSNPGSTTTDVAKAVFNPEDKEEMRNSDRKVRYYLTEKYPHLVEKDGEGEADTYSVDQDRVWFGPGRVEMNSLTGENVSMGLGGTLMYIDSDGRPVISVLGEFRVDCEDTVFEWPMRSE